METCIRCHRPIKADQACVPVFRGADVDACEKPPFAHYLKCCTECGALGDDTHRDPKPHQHLRRCSHYERPPICGARIEGTPGGSMPCTLIAGHTQKRHRAKGRFADAVELTITWPGTGS